MTDKHDKPRELTAEEIARVSGGAIVTTGNIFSGSASGTNSDGDDRYVAEMGAWGGPVAVQASIGALAGESGHDTMIGRGGNDTFDGGGGNNVLEGGGGDDRLFAGDGQDTMFGGAGRDAIMTGGGNDFVSGGTGADNIDGGAGDDTIDGGADADLIEAGDGNDQIYWQPGEGNDTVMGGAGTDTLVLNVRDMTPQQVLSAIRIDNWQGRPEMEGDRIKLNGSGTLTIGDETIRFSGIDYIAFPSTLTGGEGGDNLLGHTNSQVLLGGGGDDVLAGAQGHDTIQGGSGDDLAIWTPGDGSDSIDGGTGTDTLRLDRLDITPEQILDAIEVDAGGPQPVLTGDGRIDVSGVTGRIVLGGVTIDFRNLEYIEGPRVTGTDAADRLAGSAFGDNIAAGGGDDTVTAGYGNDSVRGQDGNDVIVWQPQHGSDSIDGGAGADTLRLEDSRHSIAQILDRIVADPGSRGPAMTDDGRIYVQGVTGSLTIDGQVIRFANLEYIEVPRIAGTDRAEVVAGGTGTELVDAGAGDDTVIGGGGNDTVSGGAGQDLIVWASGDGRDSIDGGSGLDTLRLEDIGMAPADLLLLIRPDAGVAAPVLLADGTIQVNGPGSFTLWGETVRFSNIEYIVAGSYTYYEGRQG